LIHDGGEWGAPLTRKGRFEIPPDSTINFSKHPALQSILLNLIRCFSGSDLAFVRDCQRFFRFAAQQLSTYDGHLSKIERGKTAPSLELLILLSERFHKSVIGYCGEKGISRFCRKMVPRRARSGRII
jgi:Helix-turn-helix